MGNSENWASIIPEFYFDLISRIPSGLALIAIVIIVVTTDISSETQQELVNWLISDNLNDFPFFLTFILLIGTGYTISIPLAALGELARLTYSRKIWKRMENIFPEEIALLNKNYNSTCNKSKLYRMLHDELKNSNAQAKVILPKMDAEVSLCDNLATAIGVSFTIASLITLNFSLCFFFITVFIVILILCSAACHYDHLLMRHLSFASIEGLTKCVTS